MLPKKPEDVTFEEITKALQGHYKSKTNPVYERFVFYKCNQKSGESEAQYVAYMKLLAATCDFGEKNLEEMLRNRFIQGIVNSETQHKILTDPELTFQRAVEIAKGQCTAYSRKCTLWDLLSQHRNM